jgi:hypothetical protein
MSMDNWDGFQVKALLAYILELEENGVVSSEGVDLLASILATREKRDVQV